MSRLAELTSAGEQVPLIPSFPCVTWPVEANMLTGKLPADHGIVGNGLFHRESGRVEMWTLGNAAIQAPQVWDLLHEGDRRLSSAAWFPMLSKDCGADYICMPAPVHNPDGSESLWCYTRPVELYGELRDQLGHFPLHHFWGPLANIRSTAWIVASARLAAERFQPDFFYIYLPHLDYAAQKSGPDSPAALAALNELDAEIGHLADGIHAAWGESTVLWLVASEYAIVPVDHVSYPNRVLREAGLLTVRETAEGGEQLDFAASRAWALVDHQLAHVFVRDADPRTVAEVVARFTSRAGLAEVLAGPQRSRYRLDHPRAGEVVLISAPHSWQACYWWLTDEKAPAYARTVDIHRKPGYDPLELFFDPATKGIPLDATLVRGSHGAPAASAAQRGILLASRPGVLDAGPLADTAVAEIVLRQFRA